MISISLLYYLRFANANADIRDDIHLHETKQMGKDDVLSGKGGQLDFLR